MNRKPSWKDVPQLGKRYVGKTEVRSSDHRAHGLAREQRVPMVWAGDHSHFIGASKDLATVTITLVPNTWKEKRGVWWEMRG